MQIRVYYEDTDCGGIVYHTNYLKYCERARSEIFFKNKIPPLVKSGGGFVGFVVKEMDIKFLSPAKLGDILEVNTRILKLQNASVELEQKIILKERLESKEQKEIFIAKVVLVCLESKTQKIVKIPQILKEVFKEF
ncbi:MAG: YbgC/FadM family acyl-CoA thioesterase [Helicobacter sp.]|nr:YbgC/FadM family acyl-CoA thioesterase [Helicobacter sp.]